MVTALVHGPIATSPDVDPDRPEHFPGLAYRLRITGHVLSAVAAILGVTVLFGYVIRNDALVELAPSLPPMYPNAALGLLAGGLGVALATSPLARRRRFAMACAVFITSIGAITLTLHIADVGPTFMESLWPDDPFVGANSAVPGRPAAETCVAFVLLGISTWLLASRLVARVCQAFALAAATVGASAALGHIIGVDRSRIGSSLVAVGMALHTAIGLMMLGTAVLLVRPTIGIMGLLTSAGPGGRLGRRLVLAAVAAPLLLSTASALLLRSLPDALLAQSILTVLQAGALGALVMVPAAAIDHLERVAADVARVARRRDEAEAARDDVVRIVASQLVGSPTAPDGWELAVMQEPAVGELAGDVIEVLVIDADHTMLVVMIDVAGHGTGPALQGYRLRVEMVALWREGLSPAAILTRVNHTVLELDTIASAVVMQVQLQTGELIYANAGHPAPAHWSVGAVTTWERSGPMLGLSAGSFADRTAVVAGGDVVVLFTDGVSEARRPGGDILGSEAIYRSIGQWAHEGPQTVVATCIDAARLHAGLRLPDDALIFALRRT